MDFRPNCDGKCHITEMIRRAVSLEAARFKICTATEISSTVPLIIVI